MSAHFVVAETDADQPYLVRIIADNGEELFRSSENYADERAAEHAVLLIAQMFGAFSPEILRTPDGTGHVFGGRKTVEIVWTDERTTPVIPPERVIPPAKTTAPKRPRKTAAKPRRDNGRRRQAPK